MTHQKIWCPEDNSHETKRAYIREYKKGTSKCKWVQIGWYCPQCKKIYKHNEWQVNSTKEERNKPIKEFLERNPDYF